MLSKFLLLALDSRIRSYWRNAPRKILFRIFASQNRLQLFLVFFEKNITALKRLQNFAGFSQIIFRHIPKNSP